MERNGDKQSTGTCWDCASCRAPGERELGWAEWESYKGGEDEHGLLYALPSSFWEAHTAGAEQAMEGEAHWSRGATQSFW